LAGRFEIVLPKTERIRLVVIRSGGDACGEIFPHHLHQKLWSH
jgi:hypothetical protein